MNGGARELAIGDHDTARGAVGGNAVRAKAIRLVAWTIKAGFAHCIVPF